MDIGPVEFYERISNCVTLPTTSQPTVQDFSDVYEELTGSGDQIISIHISSKLSGTVNSATQAKQNLKDGSGVEIIDTMTGSMAAGIAALSGAKAIQSGADYDKVVSEIKMALDQSAIYFLVDTLDNLQKGGRIGKAQAYLGSILNMKPILTARDGEVHPYERVRSRNKAIGRLSAIAAGHAPLSDLCILHTTTPDEAQKLRETLGNLLPTEDILMSRIGPVVGTHLGSGALGIAMRASN